MVKLHVKKGDESQFLYETTVELPVDDLMKDVTAIYNGRLKVQRICAGKNIKGTLRIHNRIWQLTSRYMNYELFHERE